MRVTAFPALRRRRVSRACSVTGTPVGGPALRETPSRAALWALPVSKGPRGLPVCQPVRRGNALRARSVSALKDASRRAHG